MVDFIQLQEIAKERLERDRTIQSIEAVGPTIEAAVSDAAALLDIPVRRVEYEVLERGTSGFWGMGKKDWRIQAYEKVSAKKKKQKEDFLTDELEDELPIVEDHDGEVFVQMRSGGEAMLKVTPPSGKGKKAQESYAIQLLNGRNVEEIDADAVKRTIREAIGSYIMVGTFTPHTYNDSVVRVEISEGEMFTIGRFDEYSAKPCNFEFDSHLKNISREHAKIEKTSSGFCISMMKPTSSDTFINGNKIQPKRQYPLKHHDRVSFGALGIDYEFQVLTK